MPNDRKSAVEAQTVRLYFRNYASNVLSDPSPLPTVSIHPRGSASPIYAPSVIKESVGVFYVDWSIPSSTIGSLKYSPAFTGPGDWQDTWKSGATTLLAQDFFVHEEGYPANLQSTLEPLRLVHTLETQRLEIGAKDYITWRITEANGRLTPGISAYPEGEVQLFFGDQLIKNYEPFIHNEGSEIYRHFIDTTSLESGVYKLQGKFFIPQGTVNEPATITTEKSLSSGFSTPFLTNLVLSIDETTRTISFPSSSTQASTQGVCSVNPADLVFIGAANDLVIIDSDGTEKQVRLVNTPTARNITSIVAELNGTLPAAYTAGLGPTLAVAPILTSGFSLSPWNSAPAGINGTTLQILANQTLVSIQFSSVTNLIDIVTQINTAFNTAFSTAGQRLAAFSNFIDVGGTESTASSGILVLGDFTSYGITSLEISGGTALPLLGFTQGQNDDNVHSLAGFATVENLARLEYTVGAGIFEIGDIVTEGGNTGTLVAMEVGVLYLSTNDTFTAAAIGAPSGATGTVTDVSNVIGIFGQSAGTIRLLSATEGSVANTGLGFSGVGITATGDSAEGGILTGTGIVYPINIANVTTAFVQSSTTLTDFEPVGSPGSLATTLDGTDFDLETTNPAVGPTTITFADDILPAAITSTFTLGSFNVGTYEFRIYDLTLIAVITFSGAAGAALSLANVIAEINAALLAATITTIVADQYQGALRIRATGTGTSIQILDTVAGTDARPFLGLTTALLSHPEDIFQNDQVYNPSTTILQANDYVLPYTLDRIVDEINTGFGANVASLSSNKLVITHTNSGSTSALTLAAGTPDALILLGLSPVTALAGTNGVNDTFRIAIDAIPQNIVLAEGIKGLSSIINDINSQVEGLIAENVGGQLSLRTLSTGATVDLVLTDPNTSGALTALGFGPTTDFGLDATIPLIYGSSTLASFFKSSGNATFIVSWDNGGTVETEILDLTGLTTLTAVASAIQAAFTDVTATATGSTLTIKSIVASSNERIAIGSLNEGSNANSILGFSVEGVEAFGTSGQPYTLSQIVSKINSAFGGSSVASASTNFLTLTSIEEGSGGSIIIEEGTSIDLTNIWGLERGTYVGTTTTQVSQTIVSNKLQLFIGD